MVLLVIIVGFALFILPVLWESFDYDMRRRADDRKFEKQHAETIDFSNRAVNYYRGRPEIDIATKLALEEFDNVCKNSPDKEKIHVTFGIAKDKVSFCTGSTDFDDKVFYSNKTLVNFKDKGIDEIYPAGFFPNLRSSLQSKCSYDIALSCRDYKELNPYALGISGKNKYYKKKEYPF